MVLGKQTICKSFKAILGFFLLLAAAACAGLSPQGGGGGPAGPPNLTLAPPGAVNGADGENNTVVVSDQPIRNEQPVPFIDPTCQGKNDKARCLKDGVFFFNEEKRTYTPVRAAVARARTLLRTDIEGHVFLAKNQVSQALNDSHVLLIKETVSNTCLIAKTGMKDGQVTNDFGAVYFSMLTPPEGSPPALVVPAFRYSLAKEGYDHPEGLVECSSVEGDFSDNRILKFIFDFIVWDECFAPLPPIGSPLNLGVGLNESWVADYCTQPRQLAPATTTIPLFPHTLHQLAFPLSNLPQLLNSNSSSGDDDSR